MSRCHRAPLIATLILGACSADSTGADSGLAGSDAQQNCSTAVMLQAQTASGLTRKSALVAITSAAALKALIGSSADKYLQNQFQCMSGATYNDGSEGTISIQAFDQTDAMSAKGAMDIAASGFTELQPPIGAASQENAALITNWEAYAREGKILVHVTSRKSARDPAYRLLGDVFEAAP